MTSEASIDQLHPPLSQARTLYDPRVDGEYLCNVGAAIQLAKDAGTPEGKRFYRAYVAEYRALNGQPLTHEKREEQAFFAAAKRVGWNIVDKGRL
jgi:hypothetical protein